ncbi:PFE-CTERM domain-containing protein [Pleurocapsa sp. FMAR1]|uniref:PFE-CTERM domain-containing protein n=1 Tax=Pleurocapsa sp. FMAR1 TaxID=3040204 RepID=UPI0029C8F80E|nr:hypothetical protein [Pleurocapsa sp. FMAR1]
MFAKSASALDFNFSFNDNGSNVSGTIFGLNDDTSSQSSSSVSLSTPSNLTFNSPNLNSFTVANGAITGVTYRSGTIPNLRFIDTSDNIQGSYRGTSQPVFITPVTFSQVTGGATPVPFGVAPNMGILILGGMFGASRLRNKIAARKLINSDRAT